ncbi:MAG: histidine kinase [gamma proteobacterium symbiont of Taylorina sp.]|nr:histidine kinase [gamma proteobacterium symbiont of Taylorina sp.]
MYKTISDKNSNDALFLPDFCDLKMVFTVVIIGELLAFILTLAPLSIEQQRWNDLALISLFIQWNGLLGSSGLCLLRPVFRKYSNQFVAAASYLTLLFIIVIISEVSFFIINYYQISSIISSTSHWEFLLHNLLIGAIISALALRYFYIQHQWRIKVQTESKTKLQLLQARIRPHFLFNSMNTIASLTRTQPKVAERITEDLAELFRMLLKDQNELILWSHELILSQRYLDIEKQRLGERLCVHWEIDDIPDKMMVPALLLQPLLENAIFHGIEPEIKGGTIWVKGEFKQKNLIISIQNSNSKNPAHRDGNQMALENIRERLRVFYQGNASIHCKEENEFYFTILKLPYLTKHEDQL